jgi:hypothetical protein
VAIYQIGTGSRSGSGTITITDGGGTWTAIGGAVFSRGFNWSATFYSSGGVRRCTLVLSGGVGAGTFDFDTTGIALEGTFSLSIPYRQRADIGTGFGIDRARAYHEQSGAAVCSLTLMGYTMTITNNQTGSLLLASWTVRSRCEATSAGGGSQVVAWTSAPGVCSAPSSAVSASGSGVVISGSDTYSYSSSASTSATSATASISKTVSGGQNGPTLFGEAVAICGHDRDATLHCRLNRLMAAWPDTFEYRLTNSQGWQTSATGNFTASIAQRSYDHLSTCWDHSVPFFQSQTDRERVNTLEQLQPVARYVSDGVTTTVPLLVHGPKWDALTFTHTQTQDVDNGSTLLPTGVWSGAWTGQSGGSVASVGGAIEITGAAGKAARRQFTNSTHYNGWRSYSRLKIRLKCSAADHPITLRLEESLKPSYVLDPEWTINTGAADTYTDHYIDLGAENNGPDLSIAGVGFQSGTPNLYWTDAYAPKLPDRLWLEDLGAGTYSIDSIELSNHPDGLGNYTTPLMHATMFTGFGGSKISAIADGNTVYDNTRAVESESIAQWISYANNTGEINYQRGWSVASSSVSSGTTTEPYPTSELTTDRWPLYFLGGRGILWDGGSQTWSTSFGTGGASSTGGYGAGAPIPAQYLVQQISWDWPTTLLGFITDDMGVLRIGAGAVVGRSAWGRVLSTGDSASPVGRDGVSGATVSLSTPSGEALATTTTDANGWYSLPAVAANHAGGRLTIAGRTVETSLNQHRTRIVATEAPTTSADMIGMAVSATQRVCRGVKGGGGVLSLEWRRKPARWDATVTPLTLTGGGALCFDTSGVEARLWLAYEDAGGIKTRYTEDEGSTFSVAVTIVSAGTYPAIAISPTSVRHYYWVDGSAIKTKILDSQGATLTATTTVVASGVASSAIDAVYAGEEIFLTYQSTAGAVVSVRSVDGGITFS